MIEKPPPFVIKNSENEYKEYFEKNYCNKVIMTFDNIRVYFRKEHFKHAFFESSKFNKIKDKFSFERAKRIDWIAATLKNKNSKLFKGWNGKKKMVNPNRRVAYCFKNYIVVIEIKKSKEGILKGEFITAFSASNKTIKRICSSPIWNIEDIK